MRNNFHYYMCSWLIFVILLNVFLIVSAASAFLCFVIKVLFCKVFVLKSIRYV